MNFQRSINYQVEPAGTGYINNEIKLVIFTSYNIFEIFPSTMTALSLKVILCQTQITGI